MPASLLQGLLYTVAGVTIAVALGFAYHRAGVELTELTEQTA
ncbi:MAG TPA: hypothetical protein VK060_06985 [Ruania sp.]|nr:hypothetical protein [Ruania sp.]